MGDRRADLRAGLSANSGASCGFCVPAGHVDRVIAVGDVFAGWVAGTLFARQTSYSGVATAKSEYIHGHSRLETWWMRRRASTFSPGTNGPRRPCGERA